MKQRTVLICLLLTLALLLTACGGGTAATEASVPASTTASGSETEPDTGAQTQPSEDFAAQWEAMEGKGRVGAVVPDFTVMTPDGEFFTLSEALKERELVLINLWATWCPPCNSEFPHLQEAYREYKDHVAVIALSVEETDTMEMIRQTAETKKLTFPMGRDEQFRIARAFKVSGIPTSILVDRDRTVLWIGTGAMSSAQDFADLFDQFLPGGPLKTSYRVLVQDQDGKPVPGCVVNFCTDTACNSVTTDRDGSAVFKGLPDSYHIQLLTLPEGYEYEGEEELTVRTGAETLTITVTRPE